MGGSALHISSVTKRYGDTTVLDRVGLEVGGGEFMTLLGPSGCGKSTLLRIIAGLEAQTAGGIALGGRSIDGLPPKKRGVAMVFQNYALYPHMSVCENLSMPLVMRRMSFAERFPGLGFLVPGARAKRAAIGKKVEEIARVLEINQLLARRPGQLSGGQRQRVALGRAMMHEPAVFLMDEPLSNLDARLRVQMRAELTDLHRSLGVTFLYVTHDQIEAMTMSERIAVMMDGQVVQVGTPREIYAQPSDLRVARFFGTSPINVLPASLDADRMLVLLGRKLPIRVIGDTGPAVSVAIRPEDFIPEAASAAPREGLALNLLPLRAEDHGADTLMHLRSQGADAVDVRVRVSAAQHATLAAAHAKTGHWTMVLPVDALHVFGDAGRRVAVERFPAAITSCAGTAT